MIKSGWIEVKFNATSPFDKRSLGSGSIRMPIADLDKWVLNQMADEYSILIITSIKEI